MSHQPARLFFESDGESLNLPTENTSPISNCLARFEFEFGRGNEGTKILMVEWEAEGANTGDSWEVSWEGKRTVLSARESSESKEKDDKNPLHRLYFMLGPGQTIPPTIKIARKKGSKSNEEEEGTILFANPLPAIFPKELGISGREEGKKGVLHTRWAKRRLGVLKEEIEREKMNVEGVGLDMAIREREWIIENFGVGGNHPVEATSPRTPLGGRLSEKLKGLKLGTSTADLQVRPPGKLISTCFTKFQLLIMAGNIPSHIDRESSHPLSPDTGDVAFSSFALFHSTGTSRPLKPAVAQHPSISHQIAVSRNSSRMSSLDAITSGDTSASNAAIDDDDEELEDGLFAVKMSPRSPEMTKSPFSFTDPKDEALA